MPQTNTALAVTCLALLPLGCAGEQGDSCSSSGDCGGDLFCSGPNEFRGCGIGPAIGCGLDADCFDGNVCHAIADACSADGIGSQCDPPCTADSCGPGRQCGATGACEFTRCGDDDGCGPHQTCDTDPFPDTMPVHQRTDGCNAVACSADSECANDTVCVNATCQVSPGVCSVVEVLP